MAFDSDLARRIAREQPAAADLGEPLLESFAQIGRFLYDNPDRLSWRSKPAPDVTSEDGLYKLAHRYFAGYTSSDFPPEPSTVPDEMVGVVMQIAFNYTPEEAENIKLGHQHAMGAENCIGSLLERYLDSVLHTHGWHWCCGDFVKAVDFIREDGAGGWVALQIKNRDNSENSSSSAIRQNTTIQKWFRSFSKTGRTNWDRLPELMRGYALSEEGFKAFVIEYLERERSRRRNPL